MGKRGKWDDEAVAWETDTGEFDLAGTIENRRCRPRVLETPTQYEAPKDRKWKARNVVTIHWQHLGIECPYPSMVHIFACVIDHSNINNGRCDASQRLIALETGFHRNTVRRVLQWVEDNTPFLTIERRSRRPGGKFKSHAYHVEWNALELHWIAVIEAIERTKETWRIESASESPCTIKGVHGHAPSRGDTDHAPSRVCSNHEYINHEEGNTSLREHSNECPSVESRIREKREGIQEEPFTDASSSSSDSERMEAAAHLRLERDLRHGLSDGDYSAVVHWLPFPGEVYGAAIAAEIEAPHTGAVFILDAYRREKSK